MDTSIEIKKEVLPKLLSKIGEALGCGKNIEISESVYPGVKYQYIKIGDEPKKLLSKTGEGNINSEYPSTIEGFSQEEIKMMEEYKDCPESGNIDLYTCKYICELRNICEKSL